jgi:hypothetical protein
MRPPHATQGQPLPAKIGHHKSNLSVQIQRNVHRRMRRKVQERQTKHVGKGGFIGSSPGWRAAAAGAQGRRASAGTCCRLGFCDARKKTADNGVASREAALRLGSLTAQNQISPRLGFRVGGGTPLIPDTLLVSADVIQPIPIIFCIGWLTSANTNKARPINIAHTPLFWWSTQWRRLLFRLRELFRPRLFPFLRCFFNFL